MSKKNVLVFPSATYPAMQIIDCLKNSPRFHIIAGASYPNHAELVCDDAVTDIPFLNNEHFLESICKLVEERKIEYIIPTDDNSALVLTQLRDQIPAVIVCSPYETARICRYKSLTYERLAGEKYVPVTYSAADVEKGLPYPVFIKPDNSQGSRGARLVESKEEMDQIENLEDYVICEYLPGEEYTVDCFTNKDRQVIFCNPRNRSRIMNGITARGQSLPLTDEFREVIDSINERIEFRGYWFVQLRRDAHGKLKLLEVCTRFAGSFAISKGLGANLPLLALCDFSGLPASAIVNDYTVICDKTYTDRYLIKGLEYDHVFVDYDDTVTCNEGTAVNPYVIAYLYQCRFKKIKITLITRHKDTFGETLEDSFRRLKIAGDLFDEIIELSWDGTKQDAIQCADKSIFIDNSFKERKEIHDKFGIPVFDVCNIDCLFDWRTP